MLFLDCWNSKPDKRPNINQVIAKLKEITKEIQHGNLKKYLLVMEYADGGTLKNYLKERFANLTWNDKLNLALQLARGVSCLHDEGIVHCDLVIYLIS